ncbi:MAG: hypothetical protein ABIS21_02790 [Acidimicrobiales bacterium]
MTASAPYRRRPALLLAALLVVFAAAGCSGGGDDVGGGKKAGAGAKTGSFAFTLAGTEVQSPAPQPPPFPEDVKAAVMASLDAYLANGVAAPLQSGKPSSGLEAAFTGAAIGRLAVSGPERAALLEEGTPVSGKVTQARATAKLTALMDPAGAVAVVVSQLDFALTVKGKGTTLTVVRTGEMALVFDNNAWRIDSFDLRTARDGT